jgi:hypothetical protein
MKDRRGRNSSQATHVFAYFSARLRIELQNFLYPDFALLKGTKSQACEESMTLPAIPEMRQSKMG